MSARVRVSICERVWQCARMWLHVGIFWCVPMCLVRIVEAKYHVGWMYYWCDREKSVIVVLCVLFGLSTFICLLFPVMYVLFYISLLICLPRLSSIRIFCKHKTLRDVVWQWKSTLIHQAVTLVSICDFSRKSPWISTLTTTIMHPFHPLSVLFSLSLLYLKNKSLRFSYETSIVEFISHTCITREIASRRHSYMLSNTHAHPIFTDFQTDPHQLLTFSHKLILTHPHSHTHL